ncbi:MAG: hypothetical protein ACRC67_03040 [Inquilinus sp.]|uniref:hypothetical protein n=1 Tax=Inquilinus sp. TaxID=1932117 RepID=UPI003F3B64AE
MDRDAGQISEQQRSSEADDSNVVYLPRREGTRRSECDSGNLDGQGDRYESGNPLDPPLTVYRPDGTLKSEWWFSADGAHRIDGPAYVRHNRDGGRIEHWYLHHRRHRTSGPAIIEWAKDGSVRRAQWWIGGKEVTEIAESFLAEAETPWPLDTMNESTLLRRGVGELRSRRQNDEIMRPEPIVVGVCLASLFWLPVVLTVALLWA